eukprot:g12681.t1
MQDLQSAPEPYLKDLQMARNVYLYLTFDRAKPSKAFCGIYAPALSEEAKLWLATFQELETYLSELFAKAGEGSDVVRVEVSSHRGRLDGLVLWAEQRLQEIRKHDGGCICIVSSQLSTGELRGLAPSCYLQPQTLRRSRPRCPSPQERCGSSGEVLGLGTGQSRCTFGGDKAAYATEGRDESVIREAWEERCQSLRSSFALALRSSLQQTEEGKTLLVAPPRPPKALGRRRKGAEL